MVTARAFAADAGDAMMEQVLRRGARRRAERRDLACGGFGEGKLPCEFDRIPLVTALEANSRSGGVEGDLCRTQAERLSVRSGGGFQSAFSNAAPA